MSPTSKPFKCDDGTDALNPSKDCCGTTLTWCPHTNKCVANATDCCTTNPATPIFCQQTQTCVSHNHECCSNFKTTLGNQLVKCTHENKCVPSDTVQYCFQPFDQACDQVQCPFDGKCVKSIADCAATRVCPTGYYMCPDYTCLPGLAQTQLCELNHTLSTCTTSTNLKGRCSDGLTCSEDLQMCPSQVTCPQGQVLCPDNTCVSNQLHCIQIPGTAPPKLISCGKDMLHCPDGQCAHSCAQRNQTDCISQSKVRCPGTSQCASSYEACPTSTYCPLATNYTYSLKSIVCGGPNLCTWDQGRCKQSYCHSKLNYFELSNVAKPWTAYDPSTLKTCPDGRCTQYQCMTEVSCSDSLPIKSQIVGSYCTLNEAFAEDLGELAYTLQALVCPPNLISCLSGHCRATIYDCPQFVTCPVSRPVMCQDGQCVATKNDCELADKAIYSALTACFRKGLLLCQSDLQTCTISIEQCPTQSTCPFGYTKCLENKCAIGSQCSSDIPLCDDRNPLYCRSLNQCVSSLALCPSLTVCPADQPVKCASDQSCKSSIQLCVPIPTNYVQTAYKLESNITQSLWSCGSERLFRCQNGQCKVECEEWLPCPQGQVQCFNGKCLSDLKLCPNETTGCPFNLPVWCPFMAKCVKDQSRCFRQSTAYLFLNQSCSEQYSSLYAGCPKGNCVRPLTDENMAIACARVNNKYNQSDCAKWAYPNDILSPKICYSWQCPQQVPIKCANGLCVADKSYCAPVEYSAKQLNFCKNQSDSSGYNLRYPCGNGQCVSTPDQCTPLYDCVYNQNGLIYRCNDGTCKASLLDCNIATFNGCPYRCQTGQCVDDSQQCNTENGCTIALPFKCEFNGVCMANRTQCFNTTRLLRQMSLSPQRVSASICESRGLVTCVTDQMIMYCSNALSSCYSVTTGCPVTAPMLCGGWCVKSIADCAQVTRPSLNNQGCAPGKPFRCSSLLAAGCFQLPFTSYSQLYQDTCSALTQSLVGKFPINKCSSSLTPFSCADGSCTESQGLCPSCAHWCVQMMGCTATEDECTQFGQLKAEGLTLDYQQKCSTGSPIRCVMDGKCVQNATQCLPPQSTAYNSAYTGMLLDATCPSLRPIRCLNGNCTDEYTNCLEGIDMRSNQMLNPVAWATNTIPNTTCRIYCADGSCRDQQENCPLAQACSSPEKPFRCLNGLCEKEKSSCIALFGYKETETRGAESAYCIKRYGTQFNLDFVKCEDGTCRPATYDRTLKLWVTSCPAFIGCPLNQAYQCQTGQCVSQLSDCLQFSNRYLCQKDQYMCKNMACVSDPALCNADLSSLPVLQLQVELSPWRRTRFDVVFNRTQPIITIEIPQGSIPFPTDLLVLHQDSYKQLRINPVPYQSYYTTPVSSDALNYTQERYTLQNNSLNSFATLLLPALDIQTSFVLIKAIKIEFKLDLPTNMDLKSDVCLAQLRNNLTWECVTRDLVSQSGRITASTMVIGKLAVIFSPDMQLKTLPIPSLVPTPVVKPVEPVIPVIPVVPNQTVTPVSPTPNPVPTPAKEEICDWWCKYKWYIIGGAGGLLILILLVLVLCCWYRSSQAQKRLEAEQAFNKNINSSKSMHNENLLTNYSDRTTVDRAMKKEQDDLRDKIKQQDTRIQELEQSVKSWSRNQTPHKQNLPDSPYSKLSRDLSALQRPEFGYELRAAEDRIKEHYRSEVLRVAAKLQKEQEAQGGQPPKQFGKQAKDVKLRDYTSDETYEQQNWPRQHKPKLDTFDQKLSDQWNKLVYEYRPPQELLTSTSRPLLVMSQSDLAKSSKSQERGPDKRQFISEQADEKEFRTADNQRLPRSRKYDSNNDQSSSYTRRIRKVGPQSIRTESPPLRRKR